MANAHFNNEQQFISDHINNIAFDLYFIKGMTWSSNGKMFFIKHLINHLIQMAKKKILLCVPMDAAVTRLLSNANIMHGHFRLSIKDPIMPFNSPTWPSKDFMKRMSSSSMRCLWWLWFNSQPSILGSNRCQNTTSTFFIPRSY